MSALDNLMYSSPSLSKRPSVRDLFTMQLSSTDMWYKLGLELGLSVEELDAIKTAYVKPRACKKEMFKKWLNECPQTQCTWLCLLQALAKLDRNLALGVFQTVATDDTVQPHTPLFPTVPETSKKEEMQTVDTTKPPFSTSMYTTVEDDQLGNRNRDQPQTEVISRLREDPSSSVSLQKKRIAELLKKQASTSSNESALLTSTATLKTRLEMSHGSDEIRSGSADAFQTADEDEAFQPLKFSYQHSDEALEHNMPAKRHQVKW